MSDREDETMAIMGEHFKRFRKEILVELQLIPQCQPHTKDILIVCHNQLHYLRNCIDSIQKHTRNYHIYVWDNASNEETQEYLKQLNNTTVIRNEENIGFIQPNNELAKLGTGDYLILLNSDTKVFEGWDTGLISYLQHNSDTLQTGYLGGVLDKEGMGGLAAWGKDIDYICGFCSCISRETYTNLGLFDDNLKFAYCEDADLSLRIKDSGKDIYALHLMLVHHYENKTIQVVHREGKINVAESFKVNHAYMKQKWESYLRKKL